MKRSISIPQQAVIELGLDLDIADMAIFDFICSFAHSQAADKILTEDQQHFAYWISAKLIQNQLPILRMKERTIKEHVAKLVDAGLLCKYGDPRKMQKAYYTFGPLYEKIMFFNEHGVMPAKTDGRNLFSCPTSAENRRPLCEKPQTPLRKSADNNNIEDNIIEDKKKKVEKKSASAPPPTSYNDLFSQKNDASCAVNPSANGSDGEKEKKVPPKKERDGDEEYAERRGVSAVREAEELSRMCLKDEMWLEAMEMGGFTRAIIESKLQEFVTHLRMTGKENKTIADFKRHFNNWLRKSADYALRASAQPKHVVLDMETRMDIIRQTCNNFHK